MVRDYFHLVNAIRDDDKYFDVGRQDIHRLLLVRGECEIVTEHELLDRDGPVVTTLKLNISTRSETPLAWTMSLKLHGTRIDGLDHEPRYTAHDGTRASGWHRHIWDDDDESAERGKVPVTGLDGIDTREEFLIRGFKLLRVTLNASAYGIFDELLGA